MYRDQGDLQQVLGVGRVGLATAKQVPTNVAAQLRAEFGQQQPHRLAVAIPGAQHERAQRFPVGHEAPATVQPANPCQGSPAAPLFLFSGMGNSRQA